MLRLPPRRIHNALKYPIPRLSPRFASASSYAPRSPVRTGLYASAFVVSAGLFAAYYLDSRSAIHRYLITPVLRYTLDPETTHRFAVQVLRSGLAPRDWQVDNEKLKFEIWGDEITNPIGMAAGFDKNGEAIDGLFNLGFSWVEIGSITPKPQPGNPRPRVFRLPEDSALINRYGFNSDGHASVLSRLRARIPAFSADSRDTPASLHPGSLLAVNLGKNKSSPVDSIDDFVSGVRTFGPYADVLVINVSSPNTPGLRGMQSRALLTKLLKGVIKARDEVASTSSASSRPPRLIVKLAPDLDENQLTDLASAIVSSGVDGVIISNTTVRRPSSLISPNKIEQGGLSGAPLKEYTLNALKTLRAHLPASIPLIGCGGISTGADALEYAKAGASLVQIYTSFGYDGVGACRRIKDELTELLVKDGTTWQAVVDKAVQDLSYKPPSTTEGSINVLIEEAKELGKLLDQYGESLNTDLQGALAVTPSTT